MSNYWYRFTHWIFRWKQDNEGDIAFVLFNTVAFIKYKEHTLVKMSGRTMSMAGKYQGRDWCHDDA